MSIYNPLRVLEAHLLKPANYIALATHIGIVHLKKPKDDNGFNLIFIVMVLGIIGFFIFNFIKKPIPAEALDKVF